MYHYGYHTLKAGQIQFHGPALVPSDTAAVLDWGLDIPFASLGKPPLHYHDCHSEWGALSAKVPIGDCPEDKVATYPHLHPKVEPTASQPADSSPVPSIGSTYMDVLRMDTARHSGCALPTTETRS